MKAYQPDFKASIKFYHHSITVIFPPDSYEFRRFIAMFVIKIDNKIVKPGMIAAKERIEAEIPSTRPMIMYEIDVEMRMPVQEPAATSAQA